MLEVFHCLGVAVGERKVYGGQARQDEEFIGLVGQVRFILGLPVLQLLFLAQQGIQLIAHLPGIQNGPGRRIIARFEILAGKPQAFGVDGDLGESFGKADNLTFQIIEFSLYLIPFFVDFQ